MAFQHVNRRGVIYYLHEGKTKTGKPKFFLSRSPEGTLADSLPAGFEVYENPNAQVILRKALPKIVTDEEIATVEQGVRECAKLVYFKIDVKGENIVVHLADQDPKFFAKLLSPHIGVLPNLWNSGRLEKLMSYSPMMQFTLVDKERRLFAVQRWCFRGAIDGWFPLSGPGELKKLVARFCPHLGKESFFELL